MPDIQITDQLDKPVEPVPIDWTQPSSLLNRLKTEALHLAVLPDFLDRKDLILTKAATSPIRFEAKAGHQFQLGNTKPEITVAPAAHISISANTTAGSDLFDGDPFHQPATVPAHTGYVGISFEGTIDVGLASSEADLTFGFDKAATVGFEYHKAFPLGSDEPALGSALARTLAAFVIPGGIADFDRLAINDIAAVSGQRALTFSGSVSVSAAPNPLASVHLPLGLPGFSVQAAAIADVSASFTISGSWQLRVRRQDDATIELSFLREHGSALNAGLSASAGVTAALGSTDWLPKVLGAITGHGHTGDANPLADLPPSDAEAFNAALQQGLSHSLKARIEESLSVSRDDQAAFQYEIQPAQLSPDAAAAVQAALRGNLRALTEMENNAHPDGTLAPGVKMLNSLLTEVRRRSAAFKLNLIGALNFLSAAEFVRNSEVLTDGVSGEVTIRETVSGERISA
ncbi:MAG TPA: hypothetical protein VHC72_05580, partial [Bryobacteraceae bacterium]|nr:hypothetical protein [Bryobacteraceae bacterium]